MSASLGPRRTPYPAAALPASYAGARVRLQRHEDLRILNGWIRDLSMNGLLVELHEEVDWHGGDCSVEATDARKTARFVATLDAKTAQVARLRYAGTVEYRDSREKGRTRVRGLDGSLTTPDGELAVTVLDASEMGAAVESEQMVARGSMVSLVVPSGGGPLRLMCEARYCRSAGAVFRVGLSVRFVDRVSSERWLQLIASHAG